MVGGLPGFRQQDQVHGLPLQLSPEEVTLAVSRGWVTLYEAPDPLADVTADEGGAPPAREAQRPPQANRKGWGVKPKPGQGAKKARGGAGGDDDVEDARQRLVRHRAPVRARRRGRPTKRGRRDDGAVDVSADGDAAREVRGVRGSARTGVDDDDGDKVWLRFSGLPGRPDGVPRGFLRARGARRRAHAVPAPVGMGEDEPRREEEPGAGVGGGGTRRHSWRRGRSTIMRVEYLTVMPDAEQSSNARYRKV